MSRLFDFTFTAHLKHRNVHEKSGLNNWNTSSKDKHQTQLNGIFVKDILCFLLGTEKNRA